MSDPLTFRVYGDPVPQGSKKAFVANGRAMMKDSGGTRFAAWRNAVAAAASKAAEASELVGVAPVDGPLSVSLMFRHRMPASRPAAVRRRGIAWKTTAPDLDKLARAVLDGMQAGGLLRDDALVAVLACVKHEVADGWTGVEVCVKPTNTVDVVLLATRVEAWS